MAWGSQVSVISFFLFPEPQNPFREKNDTLWPGISKWISIITTSKIIFSFGEKEIIKEPRSLFRKIVRLFVYRQLITLGPLSKISTHLKLMVVNMFSDHFYCFYIEAEVFTASVKIREVVYTNLCSIFEVFLLNFFFFLFFVPCSDFVAFRVRMSIVDKILKTRWNFANLSCSVRIVGEIELYTSRGLELHEVWHTWVLGNFWNFLFPFPSITLWSSLTLQSLELRFLW